MRVRLALLTALVLCVAAAPALTAATLAQTPAQPEEQDVTGEESGGGEEGQTDPEAETGAGGESEDAAPEEGPIWTYQMARLALLGLLPLIAVMGYWYWRFVVSRSREG